MIEPNKTYYNVNTLDIWEFERDLFFSDQGSKKRVERVESKLVELIIKCYDQQTKDCNNQTIDSITDQKKLDSGQHSSGYFERYMRNWNMASKDIRERIAISIFPFRDGYYNLNQNIDVDPNEETFDFWFALKLSQYDYALKDLEDFLTFQLDENFAGNTQAYQKFIRTIVLQYEVDYLSSRLVYLINNWIAEIQNKVDKESSAYPSSLIDSLEINNKEEQIHKTFLLDIVNNQPGILNNVKNPSTFELMEGLTILKKEKLLFGDVKWDDFKMLFHKLALNDKIKWEGTLVELKWFIQEICKPGLCSHLEKGLEKWKVAQECFLIKRKEGWVAIDSYEQISNASGIKKRLPIIKQFGERLDSLKL